MGAGVVSPCGEPRRARRGSGPQQLRHAEREVDGLTGVETGVTRRRVALVQLSLEDVAEATEAFGDVVAR